MVVLLAPTAVGAETSPTACVAKDAVSGRNTYGGDLADWMTCMYPPGSASARTTQLGTVMMPGSHDAGTNALFNAEASTFHYAARCPSPIDKAVKDLHWATRQWAMAQTRTSADQAAVGSRWFDLRGVLDNYVWHSCNGLVADRWFDVFDSLIIFNASHPAEVLVIDMAQLLDPINDVSALRLSEALAPLCRKAVGPAQAPLASGIAGRVTIAEARSAGGFVIQLADDAPSQHAFTAMTRWLADHPTDHCYGKLWSRSGTRVSVDNRADANLWLNRRKVKEGANSMVKWASTQHADALGSFHVTQFTWDFTGPAGAIPYQVWLMNHWLIDYNAALARPTRDLARGLWQEACATGKPPNVILLDNISRPRPIRELIAYNQTPCH